MSPVIPLNRDELIGRVIEEAPDTWSTPDVAAAVAGLMDRALLHGLRYGDDWSVMWPLTPERWDETCFHGTFATHAVKPPPAPKPPANELLAAVDSIWAGELLKEPIPPNPWLVTSHGGNILVPEPITRPLHPDEAILLGVWLLGLADPTLTKACRMLARVATR